LALAAASPGSIGLMSHLYSLLAGVLTSKLGSFKAWLKSEIAWLISCFFTSIL